MTTLQKVLLSILVSVLVSTGFAVVAYSGLFDYVDERLYNQRIRDNAVTLLEETGSLSSSYLVELQSALGSFVNDPAIRNVFLVNQSREDSLRQLELLADLQARYPEIDFLRILDNDDGELWLSTLAEDVRDRTDVRVEYVARDNAVPPVVPLDELLNAPTSLWDTTRGALRVVLPVVDTFNVPRGFLVAWIRLSGLYRTFVQNDIIGPSNRVLFTPGGSIVVNGRRHFSSDTLTVIDDALQLDVDARTIESEVGEELVLVSIAESTGVPPLVYLVDQQDLQMADSLHYVLIGALFLTVFLAAHLLLNIRQDPVVVVSERFRRFQQSIVRDYIREGHAIDAEVWKRELGSRRERIEGQLQRGIGRVSDESRRKIDTYLEAGWEELHRMMGATGRQTAQLEPVSLAQIESIIQRTLEQYADRPVTVRRVVDTDAEPAGGIPAPSPGKRPRKAPQPVEVEEVSELDEVGEIEEVAELDELEEAEAAPLGEPVEVEEVAELDEVEEIEEVAELDELEEADAAPLGEPVEVEEVSELDEVEEIEAVAELDELEEAEAAPLGEPVEVEEVAELDEVEEIEEVAELDEIEEVEAAPLGEPVEVEEVSELDEVGEIEEVAELDEIEEVAELDELEEADAAPLGEPVEVEEVSELAEIEEIEEVAELDEIEDEFVGAISVPDEKATLVRDEAPVPPAEVVFTEVSTGHKAAEQPPVDTDLESWEVPGGMPRGESPTELFVIDDTALEMVESFASDSSAGPTEPVEVEEVTEIDEIEEVAELDELEEAEAAPLDEPVEVEEVSELDEVEEIEAVDAFDDVGEAEAAPLGEPVEVEEISELDEVEEIEEVAELDEIEEIEAVDAFDEVGEAEVAPLGEPVEVEEISELDEVEEIEEVAELDEFEEIEAVEALDEVGEAEAAPLGEPVEVEEVEETEATVVVAPPEAVEPIESFEELEPLDEAEEVDAPAAELTESEDLPVVRRDFLSAGYGFGGRVVPETTNVSNIGDFFVAAGMSQGLENIRIRGIENGPTHQIMDLEDFVLLMTNRENVIEEREGVPRVIARAYTIRDLHLDTGLLNLVDEVVENRRRGGIEDLFGDAFDFGSFDEDGVDRQENRPSNRLLGDQRVVLPELDDILDESNNIDHTDMGERRVYRALIRMSRRLDARAAVIFESTDNVYHGGISIGLPEECSGLMDLSADNDMVRNVMRFSRVALLKRPAGEFLGFTDTCLSTRLANLSSWLMLPVNSENRPVYLMLGFTTIFSDLQEFANRQQLIAG